MKNPFSAPGETLVTTGAGPGGWAGLSNTYKLAIAGGVVATAVGVVMWPALSGSTPSKDTGPAEQHQPSTINEYQAPPPAQDVISRATGEPAAMDTPATTVVYRPVPTEMSLYTGPVHVASVAAPGAAGGEAGAAAANAVWGPNAAVPTNHATIVQHPDYVIRPGAVIPCLPVDAQNSSRPSFTTCRVPDGFRSTNLHRRLLPPGTLFFGQIREGISAGHERLGINYTLIETPWFNMPIASPAGDALGRGGVDGDVQTFFWETAGAVALYAGIDALSGVGQNVGTSLLNKSLGSNGGTTLDINTSSQSLASKELDAKINRPPVMTRDQAMPVTVTVGQELDFYEGCKIAMRIDPNACPLQ